MALPALIIGGTLVTGLTTWADHRFLHGQGLRNFARSIDTIVETVPEMITTDREHTIDTLTDIVKTAWENSDTIAPDNVDELVRQEVERQMAAAEAQAEVSIPSDIPNDSVSAEFSEASEEDDTMQFLNAIREHGFMGIVGFIGGGMLLKGMTGSWLTAGALGAALLTGSSVGLKKLFNFESLGIPGTDLLAQAKDMIPDSLNPFADGPT